MKSIRILSSLALVSILGTTAGCAANAGSADYSDDEASIGTSHDALTDVQASSPNSLNIPGMYAKYDWSNNWRLPTPGTGVLTFTAQAQNDVALAISPTAGMSDPMYEIVIGGWGNSQSVIRRKTLGTPVVTVAEGLTTPGGQNRLWVSIDSNTKTIRVGRGEPGQGVFMSYTDADFVSAAQYVNFTSWNNPVSLSNISVSAPAASSDPNSLVPTYPNTIANAGPGAVIDGIALDECVRRAKAGGFHFANYTKNRSPAYARCSLYTQATTYEINTAASWDWDLYDVTAAPSETKSITINTALGPVTFRMASTGVTTNPNGLTMHGTIFLDTPVPEAAYLDGDLSFAYGPDGSVAEFHGSGKLSVPKLGPLAGRTFLPNVTLDLTPQGIKVVAIKGTQVANARLEGMYGSSGLSLSGSVDVRIPVRNPSQTVAQTVTDAAVCGYVQVTNGAICGYQTITDAGRCGVDKINQCFSSWYSFWNNCFTTDVPRSCQIESTCWTAATCTRMVTVPEVDLGTVNGKVNLTFDLSNGLTGSVEGSYCPTSGNCASYNSGNVDVDISKACVSGIPGVTGEFCASF